MPCNCLIISLVSQFAVFVRGYNIRPISDVNTEC